MFSFELKSPEHRHVYFVVIYDIIARSFQYGMTKSQSLIFGMASFSGGRDCIMEILRELIE